MFSDLLFVLPQVADKAQGAVKGGPSLPDGIDTKPISFDLRGLQHSAGFDLGKAIKENTPLDGPKADAAKIGDAIKQNTPLDGPKQDAQKVHSHLDLSLYSG